MIVQVSKICTPNETVCSTKIRKNSFGCRVSCTGLNADVSYSKGNPEDTTMDEEDKILDIEVFSKLTKDYKDFKSKFVRNIIFNSTSPSLGAHFRYTFSSSNIYVLFIFSCPFSASTKEDEIYFIEIFFDTSTYDEVEQDKKMTLEAQLGLIGGTMGLLTGFSILSGVEIIYYAIRFFASLRVRHSELAATVKDKFRNHLTK